MSLRHWLLFFLAWVAGTLSWANEAMPLADEPLVEQRMIVISEELRCLVCQNESLAGSRADLAQDLRREIRTLIKAGKTDAEIMDFMVSRYGDFVRYRPPVKPVTWVLWFGPFLLLVGAMLGLMWMIKRRLRDPGHVPLNDEQRKQAQALLQDADRTP